MKAITLKSIFYSNIRIYNVSGKPFPSSDNNKMNKYNSALYKLIQSERHMCVRYREVKRATINNWPMGITIRHIHKSLCSCKETYRLCSYGY